MADAKPGSGEVALVEAREASRPRAKVECPGRAKNPLGCSVLCAVCLWVSSGAFVLLAIFTISGLEECKAECEHSCWPSYTDPNKKICGVDGTACYDECKAQAPVSKHQEAEFRACIDKTCDERCGETLEAMSTCMAGCHRDCATTAGIAAEKMVEEDCVLQKDCDGLSVEALTKVVACYEKHGCDQKGDMSGLCFRVALLLPLFATFTFAIYKEAMVRTRCPDDFRTASAILGHGSWISAVVGATSGAVFLLVYVPHDNDFRKWPILPIALVSGTASLGGCFLLACSRHLLEGLVEKGFEPLATRKSDEVAA